MTTRLEHLAEIVDQLAERMRSCESDQNFVVMSRERRAALAEIHELTGGTTTTKETSLSEFERRLRDRQQGAKTARSAKSG